MQFTTPDMREITISDKSEACDFIKDSCIECNRKYECTGENAAFCNHMKNILVAKYGAAEGCLKESRIRHSMGVANFLFAYAKSHDWSKEEIDFYKDNKLSDKLTTKAVSTIQAGESKKVTFNYKTSDMKFDEDQNTYCSMKLSSDDEKDSNSQNDSYYGVIYRWELPGQNDISDCTVKLSSEQFTEDGLAKEPDITVKRGNLLLEKGTDYQVEYHNNVKAGMAVVAITGINRYVGRIERSYVINVAQKDHNQNNNSTENKSDKSNLIKPIVKVDKITINGISKQIAAGKSIKLTANILPKNAKNKAVNWETSNKKIATVNKNGVVKINKRAAGKTVTITAIAKDGSNKKATYKIKVMKGSVKSISIKGKKTVKAGKTLKLTAKVKASKGANKKLIWKSSNTKYATVSSSGKVIAKKTGKKKTVIITVMSTDGTNKKKTVKIKIK